MPPGLEAWAGASVAGMPWPHDASATAVTVSGSRNAAARTTADRGLRILMGTGCWATMTGS